MSLRSLLIDRLGKPTGDGTVIVGIGNTLKGDDALGPLVCELLKGKVSAQLIDAGTVPENYIQRITRKAPEIVLVVDAIDSGADPGTISLFEPADLKSSAISTHSLSPRLFADMISAAASTRMLFIGIQPASLELGAALSARVSRAAEELAAALGDIFAP